MAMVFEERPIEARRKQRLLFTEEGGEKRLLSLLATAQKKTNYKRSKINT
jgi:hypothetical protein